MRRKFLHMSVPPTQQSGFTLVETLVALTIVSIVLAGAYSAVQSGFTGSTYSRQDVTAYYIAEEGVEMIRNIRDTNLLNHSSFLAGIADQSTDACYAGNNCYVDAIRDSILPCPASSCPVLDTDPSTGEYGYNLNWDPTPFTRTIKLTRITNDEYVVTVTVTWAKGATQRSFEVRENIMNRQ